MLEQTTMPYTKETELEETAFSIVVTTMEFDTPKAKETVTEGDYPTTETPVIVLHTEEDVDTENSLLAQQLYLTGAARGWTLHHIQHQENYLLVDRKIEELTCKLFQLKVLMLSYRRGIWNLHHWELVSEPSRWGNVEFIPSM